ncbi:helix-turn-helix domain-containing protein [Actinomadura rupiterrae]|uniref:helix-turn-helix domain-containing protein n=1 Tax=Actinomadura rupiterrae TaxID=559627 RepID=UPI0020A43463|nr:helix-turn-helix transcriptional regulator [Actinomadura rupiterrae]MCP2337536.1 transcriptional regulator with XRE-family HTH domain/tetratricopeptide (TPR) repeat protein [Actinomadura rupiterrae]
MIAVEKWSGREARALREAMRLSVRDFAACLGISDRTVSMWEAAGTARTPRPHMQAILDTTLAKTSPDVQERFSQSLHIRAPRPRVLATSNRPEFSADQMITRAAADSESFFHHIAASAEGTSPVDVLHAEISRAVETYPRQPVYPTFLEVLGIRDAAFSLIKAHSHLPKACDLYLISGVACGVLANASFDLGHLPAAEAQAKAAYSCAEAAGSNWLRVWTRGMQSLIAYWDDRFADAAALAESASTLRPESGSAAVRLASIEARAHARLGNAEAVQRALHRANTARTAIASTEPYGGMLAFPEEKQLFYASTCNVWLPGARRAQWAAHDAAQAIQLYEQAPSHQQRTGELLLARLDLASALLGLGDLDGTASEVRTVLATAPDRKTDSVRRRLLQVRDFITPAYATAPAAREIREEITGYCARPSPRPPETP